MKLKSPFPYFGGKSKVAADVWERFGKVTSYVEPFFGSGAVLLGRPQPFVGLETINDKDHFVANFWRALKADPQGLAAACDWPINETDLHSRHLWLVNEGAGIIKKCYTDSKFYDLKVAGWWVWGLCQWIGSGWCSKSSQCRMASDTPKGVHKKMPSPRHHGQAVANQVPRLTGKQGINVWAVRPHLTANQGINVWAQRPQLTKNKDLTKRPRLSGYGNVGVHAHASAADAFEFLADRLRYVRVCCGDWSRVMNQVTSDSKQCAVFFDPPYTALAGRTANIYSTDSLTVGHDVHAWALKHGDNKLIRIAVCGYEGEYEFPSSWEKFTWKASEGYDRGENQKGRDNAKKERIWFSPHCLKPKQQALNFEGVQ